MDNCIKKDKKRKYKLLRYSYSILLLILLLTYFVGKWKLIVFNISPSVPMGIYVRSKKEHASYVVFSKEAITKPYKVDFHTLVKKYYFVDDKNAYVYGTHKNSITSQEIGLIPISELQFMRKLF